MEQKPQGVPTALKLTLLVTQVADFKSFNLAPRSVLQGKEWLAVLCSCHAFVEAW